MLNVRLCQARFQHFTSFMTDSGNRCTRQGLTLARTMRDYWFVVDPTHWRVCYLHAATVSGQVLLITTALTTISSYSCR